MIHNLPPAVIIGIAGMILVAMSAAGILKALTRRPAIVLCCAVAAGIAYRFTGLPMADAAIAGTMADGLLAILAFGAALQFRISRLHLRCEAVLRLSTVAAPLFLIITSLSAYVLLPDMTIWAALIIGAVLMLNGASIDRKLVISSPSSHQVKSAVSLESAATLAFGLPIAVMIETAAHTNYITTSNILDTGILRTAIGFTIGGTIGLLAGRFGNWLRRTKDIESLLPLAIVTGLLAFFLAPMSGGSAVIAAGAAGLLWSEESNMKARERMQIYAEAEQLVKPAAFILLGLVLGPRLLAANTLVILFAVVAVTLLRIFPRVISLQSLHLQAEERNFLAWFGGAPGAASALFLLSLIESPAVADQESVITIAVTCILVGVFATRVSSRPLTSLFIRRAAAARRRQFYA